MSQQPTAGLPARFDELLAVLELCNDDELRARLILRFVVTEALALPQAELELLRARDQVSDGEWVARLRAAPDMGGTPVIGKPPRTVDERPSASGRAWGEDYRSALSLAMLVFLSIVQGVLAILDIRDGGHDGKVVVLAIGTLASVALGAFIGVSWLRDLRRRRDAQDWTQGSETHLRMSDTYMSDAVGGRLSPRGACDAAFDAGYFALLSVLTADERKALKHPSEEVVVLGSRRLGLDVIQGVALAGFRHSAEDWPAFPEVVAWAERARAVAASKHRLVYLR